MFNEFGQLSTGQVMAIGILIGAFAAVTIISISKLQKEIQEIKNMGKNRVPGYYWVKLFGEWRIAFFFPNGWENTYGRETHSDLKDDFYWEEIDERRIERSSIHNVPKQPSDEKIVKEHDTHAHVDGTLKCEACESELTNATTRQTAYCKTCNKTTLQHK